MLMSSITSPGSRGLGAWELGVLPSQLCYKSETIRTLNVYLKKINVKISLVRGSAKPVICIHFRFPFMVGLSSCSPCPIVTDVVPRGRLTHKDGTEREVREKFLEFTYSSTCLWALPNCFPPKCLEIKEFRVRPFKRGRAFQQGSLERAKPPGRGQERLHWSCLLTDTVPTP